MTSPKLDRDCELVFNDNGVCELVSNADDLVQAIRVELEQNKGQFALNTAWGTPYLNETNTGILQLKDNQNRIIQEVSKVINKYDGVQKIESIEFIDKELVINIKINGEVYAI
nr:MAG TPA: baseplate wedge protein [Caudoviricetes sp.]